MYSTIQQGHTIVIFICTFALLSSVFTLLVECNIYIYLYRVIYRYISGVYFNARARIISSGGVRELFVGAQAVKSA